MSKSGTFLITSGLEERTLFAHSNDGADHDDAGASDMAVHIEEIQKGDIRTIVVDDSPAALRAMCSVVSRQPDLKFVGAASNGKEALALARIFQPDLVLLDLEMPVMDGIEAADCIRRECPTTRVVIVTVHNTQELRKLCYERGASGFIAKDALKEQLPVLILKLFGNGA
jgi:DNA-binding NarL/FixJ family response regulator